MKAILVALFVTFAAGEQLQCTHNIKEIITDPAWTDMGDNCIGSVRKQVKMELGAAIKYLAMGAYFSRDVVNRPGFAKMFFEAASEERQHAIKLISYLLNRGELTSKVSELIDPFINVDKTTWDSGLKALEDALKLEATVTKSIKGIIKVCEEEPKGNDYHISDYLTGDFLEEQYNGQRDIAGKISTLNKFMSQHGELGEFLYDKKLLSA